MRVARMLIYKTASPMLLNDWLSNIFLHTVTTIWPWEEEVIIYKKKFANPLSVITLSACKFACGCGKHMHMYMHIGICYAYICDVSGRFVCDCTLEYWNKHPHNLTELEMKRHWNDIFTAYFKQNISWAEEPIHKLDPRQMQKTRYFLETLKFKYVLNVHFGNYVNLYYF